MNTNFTTNPDGCTDSGAGLYIVTYDVSENSQERHAELYAALMAAKASNSDVKFYVNGCVTDGALNLAEIKTVIY